MLEAAATYEAIASFFSPKILAGRRTGYSERLFEWRPTLWEHEAFIEKPVTINGLREAVSLLLFGDTDGPVGRSSAA